MLLAHPTPVLVPAAADPRGVGLQEMLADALQCAFGTHPASCKRVGARVAVFRLEEWEHWSDTCIPMLSVAERERAARQRRPRDAMMLRLAYALHRASLACWLGIKPGDVPLTRAPQGCPRVGVAGWQTSLSHAGGLVAVAASTSGPIGIDVEPDERAAMMPGLSAMICTPEEMRLMMKLPMPARPMALLRLWVRKEALLKAAGIGMARPMEETPAPEGRWIALPDETSSVDNFSTAALPGRDDRVRIDMLDVLPGCTMAVASTARDGCQTALVTPAAAAAVRNS